MRKDLRALLEDARTRVVEKHRFLIASLRMIPLRLALLFLMRLILLIALFSLLILPCLRKIMPPNVTN
jgi:hypothetical protein